MLNRARKTNQQSVHAKEEKAEAGTRYKKSEYITRQIVTWVRDCKSKINYYYPQVCSPAHNMNTTKHTEDSGPPLR